MAFDKNQAMRNIGYGIAFGGKSEAEVAAEQDKAKAISAASKDTIDQAAQNKELRPLDTQEKKGALRNQILQNAMTESFYKTMGTDPETMSKFGYKLDFKDGKMSIVQDKKKAVYVLDKSNSSLVKAGDVPEDAVVKEGGMDPQTREKYSFKGAWNADTGTYDMNKVKANKERMTREYQLQNMVEQKISDFAKKNKVDIKDVTELPYGSEENPFDSEDAIREFAQDPENLDILSSMDKIYYYDNNGELVST